jgi:hypothetical protein
MWVYQEQVDGKNLTDIINEKHENVKYVKQGQRDLPVAIVLTSFVKGTCQV